MNEPTQSARSEDADQLLANEGRDRLAAQGLQVLDKWDAVVADGLRIQPRFKPEPIFAKTGVGLMCSVGVSELEADKSNIARSQTHAGQEGP